MILYSYEHSRSTPINVFNYLNLIKIIVILFVGRESFLTRYCNGHTKQT